MLNTEIRYSDPENFQFMGLWYILEYQYPTEMAVADLSCLSFRFVCVMQALWKAVEYAQNIDTCETFN